MGKEAKMKHLITATILAILSAWITYSIATGRCEADIDAAWSAGYKECHIDKNLPQPDRKLPAVGLKTKENG
jgi:hypothetical protein